MTVIERIVTVLETKGIEQKELCDKTGISPQTFSGWKKYFRNVPTDKLILISDFLQVPIRFLLTGEGDPEVKTPSLTEQECELLRIFNSLSMKDKTALLSRAYELEEQNN